MKKNLIFKIAVLAIVVLLFAFLNILIKERNTTIYGDYQGTNEHLVTLDCFSALEANAGEEFVVSCEVRAEHEGRLMVYFYSENGSQYWAPSVYIDVGTEFQSYKLSFKPVKGDMGDEHAYLAFYGEYGTGVIPTVKNITLVSSNN